MTEAVASDRGGALFRSRIGPILLFALLPILVNCHADAPAGAGDLTGALAESAKPQSDGAIGRNRPGYFHVRFQTGCHRLADHAILKENREALDLYLRAVEYGFEYQRDTGDFYFALPSSMENQGRPGRSDLASGVAFFTSSFAPGLIAIKDSEWATSEFDPARTAALVARLPPLLEYLEGEVEILQKVDRYAPNRLLIDGLAFLGLGELLENAEAIETNRVFIEMALAQIHDDGYFIEGGGYDSSYNGVALAIACRIRMIDPQAIPIEIIEKSLHWQLSRIEASGEISAAGNARVDGEKESFLGRKKDIDVAHTIEALLLASVQTKTPAAREAAERVLRFYRSQ